jgi:hypothetical protein
MAMDLTNRGNEIELVDAAGQIVDSLSYSPVRESERVPGA